MRILATVKDQSGALVGSLEKSDFTVRDNGVLQQIAVFERQTEQPLSVAVLIDNSGSTAKDLKYETDSVTRFLRALLYEVEPTSVAEFGSATALLMLVTLCATLLPACRAARTHPAAVLRGE